MCDGGILCNNPIKYALLNTIELNNPNSILHTNFNKNIPLQYPLMKYKCNVISTDFKLLKTLYNNENSPSLLQYITALSRKLFVNQTSYGKKFEKIIHIFEMEKYPEIKYTNFKLDKLSLKTIIDRGYEELKTLFKYIKN